MDSLLATFRQAGRRLAKTPGSSAAAVFAMALGIGLTASMFGIIQGLYLRGLPFPDSHELVHVESRDLKITSRALEVSAPDFRELVEAQTVFDGLAGYTVGTFNVADGGLPERFEGSWISPGFDELLGVEPVIGRSFGPADAEPGSATVALISHRVFMQRYGGEPSVLGRELRINTEPATVIGVMPPGFAFPAVADMWMPLRSDGLKATRGTEFVGELEVFGRLRDGVGLDEATAEVELIGRRIAERWPASHATISLHAVPILDEFVGRDERRITGVMFASVILVLLIASFNVANLLIGRASVRRRELAIRAALGSTRRRQLISVLAEAAVLAGGGALLGLLLAHLSLLYFAHQLEITHPPFWMEFRLDAAALGVAAVAAVAATLAAGLLPALQASRPDLRSVLSDSTRGGTGLHVGWVSRGLVITQVALSTALLIAAGLSVRSVLQVTFYDHSFEASRVLSARVGLFEGSYPDDGSRLAFFDELRRRLADHPEVVTVGVGTTLPVDDEIGAGYTSYQRAGERYDEVGDMPGARFGAVSPGYFEALGVGALGGRLFTDADRAGAPAVALVNESFARREWPGQNPIGQRLDLWRGEEKEAEDPSAGVAEVVGVVPDMRYDAFESRGEQHGVYLPLAQAPVRFAWLIVETRGDPLAFAEPLRREVLRVDADLPLYFVRSLDQVLERAEFFTNLFGVVFSLFGLAAVFLACVGLYGLMAFAVSRRTREMGVRMALGARSDDLLRMVLGQGLRQSLLGLVVGTLLGAGLSTVLASFLFEVEARDPLTFALVPLLLLGVALLACAAPARRAAQVDPMVALRHD